jgi:prophage tail gpP-like protein
MKLYTNEKIYTGWESISITRSMDALSGSFSLGLVKNFTDPKVKIADGMKCRVEYEGHSLVTGCIDSVSSSYDARNRAISVTGRDVTADIIDCSAPIIQLKNQTLTQIIEKLIEPFGIEVVLEVSGIDQPFQSEAVNPGETIYEIIDRLARKRGVLMMSDGNGKLVITRTSEKKMPIGLELGKNILKAEKNSNSAQRFSSITVLGQSGWGSSQNGYTASDPSIRHRPLIMTLDDNAVHGDCEQTAKWEMQTRKAKNLSINYTVLGFLCGSDIWQPNRLVSVKDPEFEIDQDMLISAVQYTLDSEGMRSVLTVVPKEAYIL